MAEAAPGARLYLVTPPVFDAGVPDRVAALLDAFDVACLRLALPGAREDAVARAADALRPVAHARDVPLVVAGHPDLVPRLGLDGVHLEDGARRVGAVRKALGRDAIIGAFAGTSRHEGMTAGELGADYVAFGPFGGAGRPRALLEMLAWWSEMIEVPVVAEGGLTPDLAPASPRPPTSSRPAPSSGRRRRVPPPRSGQSPPASRLPARVCTQQRSRPHCGPFPAIARRARFVSSRRGNPVRSRSSVEHCRCRRRAGSGGICALSVRDRGGCCGVVPSYDVPMASNQHVAVLTMAASRRLLAASPLATLCRVEAVPGVPEQRNRRVEFSGTGRASEVEKLRNLVVNIVDLPPNFLNEELDVVHKWIDLFLGLAQSLQNIVGNYFGLVFNLFKVILELVLERIELFLELVPNRAKIP